MSMLGAIGRGLGVYCKIKVTKAAFVPIKGAYKLVKIIDDNKKKNKREA